MKALYPGQHLPHYNQSMGKFFDPQGQVTLKWIVWSGGNRTLLRFYGCPCYLQVWGISDQKWSHYRWDNIFTNISTCIWELIFSIQGQVTPKSIVWPGRNYNSSENLWLSWLPASLMKIQSKLKALLIGQGQIWVFFSSQGQVTPKWNVWSGRNSNSSENLWLSWLSPSLMKIWSKLNALSIGQGQIWAFSALKGM